MAVSQSIYRSFNLFVHYLMVIIITTHVSVKLSMFLTLKMLADMLSAAGIQVKVTKINVLLLDVY